jgi:hypothetical protein
VTQDGLPVTSATHVKFEAVGPVLQGKIESREGVFRRIASGAAMS